MVVRQRRLVLGLSGILVLEVGAVAGASAAWGMPGLISALIGALALWDLPVSVLLDRYFVPAHGPEALPGRWAVMVEGGDEPSGSSSGPGPGQGKVQLDGELWSARIASADTPLPPAGTPVRVRAVEGLVLVVDPQAGLSASDAG